MRCHTHPTLQYTKESPADSCHTVALPYRVTVQTLSQPANCAAGTVPLTSWVGPTPPTGSGSAASGTSCPHCGTGTGTHTHSDGSDAVPSPPRFTP